MNGTFRLNGRQVTFEPGQTILDAAISLQVQIPTLCHLAGTTPTGTCGVCVVEVKGLQETQPACATPIREGMEVWTDTPKVRLDRQAAIRRLLLSGHHNCFVNDLDVDRWTDFQLETLRRPWHGTLCPSYGDCRLQDLAVAYGVRTQGHVPRPPAHIPLDDQHPMFVRDFSRCIGCGRCVKACNEVQVQGALAAAVPETGGGKEKTWFPVADYDKCVHCGECVQACPVGALFEKKSYGKAWPYETERIRTTCPYCGVGCQQWLHVKEGRIVRVTGVDGAQPNQGRLCVKGRFGYEFIYSEERLKTPLIRNGTGFREASWDEALDLVAGRFQEILRAHGPDAVAGVSCARSINEDSYQMQKFFRAVIGTNNIDHCART